MKMIYLNKIVPLFIFGCALTFPNNANAQWTMSMPPPTQTAAYFANDNVSREVSEEIVRNELKESDQDIRNPAHKGKKIDENAENIQLLNFVSSAARRQANLRKLAAEMEITNPGRGIEIRQLFLGDGENDIITQISDLIGGDGLRTDNLADVYSIFWVTSWTRAHGILEDEIDPSLIKTVKGQVEKAFSSIPQIYNSNEADKQAYAETLLVQMLMIESSAAGARANPATLVEFKTSVRAVAKALGLDLDKMTLTEDGFVPAKPRKKADASDAAGDEATALASADTGGTRDDSSSPNYALIAGAAGAGLGAAFLIGKAMGRKG